MYANDRRDYIKRKVNYFRPIDIRMSFFDAVNSHHKNVFPTDNKEPSG